MRVFCLLLALVASSLVGPVLSMSQPSTTSPAGDESELLAADRHFDADTAERRLEGWLAAFAESGAMLLSNGSTIVGHEAIAATMRPAFDDPDYGLRWTPEEARVLIPGQLGYTTGHFEQATKNAEGKRVVQGGTYVSVWKKQPDGSWKVAFDTGSDQGDPKVFD